MAKETKQTQVGCGTGCLAVVITFFVSVIFLQPPEPPAQVAPPAAASTPTTTSSAKPKPTPNPKQAAELKAQQQRDQGTSNVGHAAAVKQFEVAHALLGKHIETFRSIAVQLGSGSLDEVTAYSLLEGQQEALRLFFGNVIQMDVPSQYEEDKETLLLSLSYLRGAIGDFKSYLDDRKTSTLAASKKALDSAVQGYNLLPKTVAAHALAAGYQPPGGTKR